jgi:putative RNA 2'-phosphotransferase
MEGKYLVLSSDRDMALRMGRRRDQTPVLLEIMAAAAQKEGISFYSCGHLFLTNQIPAKFIFGPPVSKEDVKGPREEAVKKKKRRPGSEAGTFVLDINKDPDLSRRAGGKKRRGRKEEARKKTRRKRRV